MREVDGGSGWLRVVWKAESVFILTKGETVCILCYTQLQSAASG